MAYPGPSFPGSDAGNKSRFSHPNAVIYGMHSNSGEHHSGPQTSALPHLRGDEEDGEMERSDSFNDILGELRGGGAWAGCVCGWRGVSSLIYLFLTPALHSPPPPPHTHTLFLLLADAMFVSTAGMDAPKNALWAGHSLS